jgi:hypothetical protein
MRRRLRGMIEFNPRHRIIPSSIGQEEVYKPSKLNLEIDLDMVSQLHLDSRT